MAFFVIHSKNQTSTEKEYFAEEQFLQLEKKIIYYFEKNDFQTTVFVIEGGKKNWNPTNQYSLDERAAWLLLECVKCNRKETKKDTAATFFAPHNT